MKKKERLIIALWHSANMGKTETYNALAHILLDERGAIQIPNPPEPRFIGTGDFFLVVDLDGRRIGITSAGDHPDDIEGGLIGLLDNHGCEVLFCASHRQGATVRAVERVANNRQIETIWTSTYQVDTRIPGRADTFNRLKARHLFALMEEWLQQQQQQGVD